nr:DoxX-like family protein [Cyclobacteriaceae bacterium]
MQQDNRVLIRIVLKMLISLVWLINGLFCKVLNFVPRHQLIVTRILGDDFSNLITLAIGFLEILMFVWILSGIKSRLCAILQIIIVLTMNVIEFILAPDLLLFGRVNLLIAFASTGVVAI